MTVKNNSNNESAVETQCIASLPMDAPSTADLQIRIRELEKEIARLHGQIKEQRYGLTWLDVPEAFETESENKIPILEEVKEKAIDAAGRDALNASANNTPPHIIIEGDNYHALSCLNYTHRGKIDVIYIDPPYNTGNDGFTYKDKRFLKEFPDGSPVPKEHPLRHSYWLSFMSKRLELAKNLLSDKGVIFISIGDDEQANLELLCNKVFGETNKIEDYIWESTFRPDNSSPILRRNAEFVLCFAKNISKVKYFKGIKSRSEGMPSLTKAKEKLKEIVFPPNCVHTILSDGVYIKGIKDNGRNLKWELLNDIVVQNGMILSELRLKGHSYWATQEKIRQELDDGTEIWIKSETFVPYYKKTKESANRPTKILDKEIVNDYIFSNAELNNIFGEAKFNNPKPTTLISFLTDFIDKSDATILDFFAGSGTTLHATMKLNAEDGGHRQCILVQQREGDNNICENVTYERNRRVMCGYTNAKGEQVEGLGGRLKYYRTAFVGKHASHNAIDADRVELSRKAGYLLALGENTLEEIAHTDTYQIFADTRRDDVNIVSESNSLASCYTAIYFTENYAKMPDFVAEIDKLRSVGTCNPQINVYIFCWGTPEIFEGEFDDLRGISLKAIPQPILDVYKSINQ